MWPENVLVKNTNKYSHKRLIFLQKFRRLLPDEAPYIALKLRPLKMFIKKT